MASTRLPAKPLLAETGKPLIQHVVEAAAQAGSLDRVIVATDDDRIRVAVESFGAECRMTRADHPSGTDRVAEVAAQIPDAEIVVNLQGDEPEITANALDAVVAVLDSDPQAGMATLCTPIRDPLVYHDPSCVKVVLSSSRRALYFSRSPIPFHRDGVERLGVVHALAYLHIGLYAYRRDFLLRFAAMRPSPLELAEKLEQLRVLEAGEEIAIDVVDEHCAGIDTPDDYRRFVDRWRERSRAGLAKSA